MYCVSGKLCHIEKLETVGEVIMPAPPCSRSWMGLEQRCLEGRDLAQGPSSLRASKLHLQACTVTLPTRLLAPWGGAGAWAQHLLVHGAGARWLTY